MNSLPKGKVFSARTLIQEVSLEVILKVVFGIHGERFRKLKTLIVQLTDALQSPAIAGLVFSRLAKRFGTAESLGILAVPTAPDEGTALLKFAIAANIKV